MKVIEAIGRGFEAAGKNFHVIAVLFFINLIGYFISLPFAIKQPGGNTQNPLSIPVYIILLLIGVFVQGGTIGILKDAIISKTKMKLADFMKYGGKFYARILGIGALMLLIVLVTGIILGLAGGLTGAKNPAVNVALVVISFILLAILLISLYFLSFSPYIIVLGDTSVFKSMGESVRFIKGRFFQALGLVLLLLLIVLGAVYVGELVMLGVEAVVKGAGAVIIRGIIGAVLNGYSNIIISAALMVYYIAHSAAKEGGKEAGVPA